MDKKDIVEIIDLFSAKNLNKLIIKKGKFTLEVEKGNPDDKSIAIKTEGTNQADIVTDEVKGYEVKSPLVGIYYEASSSESEPFIKVGDIVEKGDTLFIIEAMKMINEITAPISGIIIKINFKNEELVQYDDVVVEIEENV